MNTLTKSDNPTKDKSAFMKSQIVFWLLAAIDGHSKNFSVFLVPGGVQLTPLYDVMSAHPPIARKQIPFQKAKLAMAVGENRHYKIKEIMKRHWLQTAKLAQFPQLEIEKIIAEVVGRCPSVISTIRKSLPPDFPTGISEPILQGMQKLADALEAKQPA